MAGNPPKAFEGAVVVLESRIVGCAVSICENVISLELGLVPTPVSDGGGPTGVVDD